MKHQAGLTTPPLRNPELHRMMERTHPGMAHWAGTGPAETVCGGCRHFALYKNDGSTGRCNQYTRMVGRPSSARPFPATTRSCSFFDPNKQAPK